MIIGKIERVNLLTCVYVLHLKALLNIFVYRSPGVMPAAHIFIQLGIVKKQS